MSKKKIIILIISTIILILLGILLINEKEEEQHKKKKPQETDYKIVKYSISEIDTEFNRNNYSILDIVSTKEEYKSLLINYKIDIENPTKKDFNNYNYMLMVIVYDECSENVIEKSIKVKDDIATIEYDVHRQCGLCAPQYNLYEISLPKNIVSKDSIKVDFNYIDRNNCPTDIAYKPILYLYPETKQTIKVNFSNKSLLTTTYPKFKDEWTVTAYPNGDLYDENGNYYYALYWEELDNTKIDFKEGFYISKDNAIPFLEEKLSILGLNPKEQNEFIMYWLPILENNKHNLVYFETTKELEKENKLIIEPQPDSLIRVRMHVKKIDKKEQIKEQKLVKQNRNGFTAVEWGGVVHN